MVQIKLHGGFCKKKNVNKAPRQIRDNKPLSSDKKKEDERLIYNSEAERSGSESNFMTTNSQETKSLVKKSVRNPKH